MVMPSVLHLAHCTVINWFIHELLQGSSCVAFTYSKRLAQCLVLSGLSLNASRNLLEVASWVNEPRRQDIAQWGQVGPQGAEEHSPCVGWEACPHFQLIAPGDEGPRVPNPVIFQEIWKLRFTCPVSQFFNISHEFHLRKKDNSMCLQTGSGFHSFPEQSEDHLGLLRRELPIERMLDSQ